MSAHYDSVVVGSGFGGAVTACRLAQAGMRVCILELRKLDNYYDYAGVIHVHSNYSDGIKDVGEIIKAANVAGCDYMILTDHNTLKASPKEGWYGNTIFLVGEEISVDENLGHYLAMRLSSEITPYRRPQEIINDVITQGGIGFIAHPFDKAIRWIFCITPVTWKDWKVTGFNGIEIWNYSHDWIDNFNGILTYLLGLIWPNSFIDGPLPEVLNKWDELLRYRKVTGIGGVDAHGYFYSYKRMFKTLRTYVLLKEALSFQSPNFEKDKNLIYEALEKGNCYVSYDYLALASGFMYSADNGQLQVTMGDELSAGAGVSLKISSPRPALLCIVKDGEVIASATNSKNLIKTVYEPGAYRVEAFLYTFKGYKKSYRPWIYSNPIYILRD